MEKYVGINALSILIDNIKYKFANRQHIHDISDINGLQQKIDELTPPPEIETSEDVILKVNQLSIAINNMTNTINSLIPSIGEIYITISN